MKLTDTLSSPALGVSSRWNEWAMFHLLLFNTFMASRRWLISPRHRLYVNAWKCKRILGGCLGWIHSPPGPSGLPYVSQFCRDCSLVRLWERVDEWVTPRLVCLFTDYANEDAALLMNARLVWHLRSIGFGNSHECGLITTFVRVELEWQYTVLLLDFWQRCTLETEIYLQ